MRAETSPAPAGDEDSRPAGGRAGGGLAGAAGGVAGLTLVSRALGFLRWVVQASTVGAGTVAGAYATANQVPNVLYEVVVGGALAATVVPLLAAGIQRGETGRTSRTVNGLLGLVLVVLVPLGALLALAADPVAGLFPVSVGTDPGAQRELVASFLRMFALQVPLYGIGVVLTGALQAHGCFTWPALTPIASSLVVMAAYGAYGVMTGGRDSAGPAALQVLGWGTTAGVAALSLPLLWPARRLGLTLRPSLRLDRGVLRRVLQLGGAGLLTLLTQQLSVLVVLAMARAGGEAGTVAVYQYTQAVYLLPHAVLVVPVATVLYPRLSAVFDGAGPAPTAARALAGTSTALVVAVATAGAGALLAVSPAAERFFGLLTDVDGMSRALAALAPALVGYALLHQVTRVLFAAGCARGAALAASTGWLSVTIVSVLAVRLAAPGGGDGAATLLALSAGLSTGMCVAGTALLTALARALGPSVLRPVLRCLAAALPVAAAGGLVCRILVDRTASTAWALVLALLTALLVAAATLGAVAAVDRDLLPVLRGRAHGTGTLTTPSQENG
ncbi:MULTISPECIES: lipid II flippase MurJ [unclassified Actinomyces]|uniref:murein biosynthesis integral membrane protein MurJ n=1 Tax=unclassified Actinomyces TaxID=2609248 RepID=UPI0020178792|nr:MULTISPECIES: lipid II flippase MurJ [unclassified Actinomyces]